MATNRQLRLDAFSDAPAQRMPALDQFKEPEKTKEPSVVDSVTPDIFKYIKENDKKSGEEWLRKNIRGITGDVASGLVKGVTDIEKMAVGTLENVYDLGRLGVQVADQYINDKPPQPFERTDYFTNLIDEGRDVALDYLKPSEEDSTPVSRSLGKIAEYAPTTAAVGKAIVTRGAKLLENPKLLADASKGVKSKLHRNLQEMMMNAAKDPKAYQALEQKISAIMATTGQLAREAGVPESYVLPIEMITAIAAGSAANVKNATRDMWNKYFNKSTFKKMAEDDARDYLGSVKSQIDEHAKRVGDESLTFENQLKRGQELQAETGVPMNSAEMVNSPELKHAYTEIDLKDSGAATGEALRSKEQASAIRKAYEPDLQVADTGIEQASKQVDEVVSELDKTAESLTDSISRKIDELPSIDRVKAGETGQVLLDNAYEKSKGLLNELWSRVGNPKIGTDKIVSAIKEAKKSALKKNAYQGEVDSEIRKLLETNFLGKTETAELAGGKIKLRGKERPVGEMSLDGIREIEGKLKERIRSATAEGKANEARILNKVLNGIFEQYRNIPESAVNDIQALRAASRKTKEFHDIYSQGENLLASKVDKQGFDKITSEGFARNYIKPNSDTVGARAEEAIDNFYNAVGKSTESKEFLSNAFAGLLKERFPDIRNANKKDVMRFINNHSRFLNQAGIKGRYDNVNKAINSALKATEKVTADKKAFMNSALSKLVGSDNPRKFISNALEGGKFDELMRNIGNIKDPKRKEYILRGVREIAWEDMLNKATSSKAIDDVSLFNTESIKKALSDKRYARNMKKLYGKEYTKRAKDFIDLIERTKSVFYKTEGLPTEKLNTKLAEQLMTGLRAAAHGFVRPDLIAAQMAYRAGSNVRVTEAQRILKEALENPEFMMQLLKSGRSYEGRKLIKSMFAALPSPAVNKDEE